MHIVLDARHFRRSTGGIGRYTQNLVAELGKLDKQNRYSLLLDPEDEQEWHELVTTQALEPARFAGHVVNVPYYSLAEQTRLPRLLRELRPDITHFTNFNHPLTWRGRFVVTIHDLTILKFPSGRRQQSTMYRQAFRFVLRDAAVRAHTILTDSEASKRDIETILGAPSSRIHVTYPGVDTNTFTPVTERGRSVVLQQLQQRYGIRAPYLLFTSQWRPHKGIITLVRAYEKLRKEQPAKRVQLVIAGKPQLHYPEIPALIQKSPYAKDIIRPGFIAEADLPTLYQGAEIFLFPSFYEGFGLTPVEAMASGVPVIASRASCLPEVLGEAALYVAPDDIDGWVATIGQLLTDEGLRTKLRELGLKRAKRYRWETMAQQTLAAYEAAAS